MTAQWNFLCECLTQAGTCALGSTEGCACAAALFSMALDRMLTGTGKSPGPSWSPSTAREKQLQV